jgi:hypothetical protein
MKDAEKNSGINKEEVNIDESLSCEWVGIAQKRK